jgi:hypothetical protein
MAFARDAAELDLLYDSSTGLCRQVCKMFCLKEFRFNNSALSTIALLLTYEISVYAPPFPS